MEYTYEFLRKCHGLRFRATINNKPQEGIIKVTSEGVMLCYGEEDPGYLVTFGRRDTLSFSESTFAILPSDFEIVPRDPDTYIDWQVGDKLEGPNNEEYSVIFRSGKLVIIEENGGASVPFTCQELFNENNRLVLTDIEKQIIKEQKRYPKDGDILANEICVVIYAGTTESGAIISYTGLGYTSYHLTTEKKTGWGDTDDFRPATDEEKQQLFDALAKNGKRWNAEKKVVEDIPKPYEFKKGEPVLVKNYKDEGWMLAVFCGKLEDVSSPYGVFSSYGVRYSYRYCIPYNEKTMHLLGTSNNYEED